MGIMGLRMKDFRCFTSVDLQFSSKINLIVGPNNSGKTTLLRAISLIQQGSPVHNQLATHIRQGASRAEVVMDWGIYPMKLKGKSTDLVRIEITPGSLGFQASEKGAKSDFALFPFIEPNNLIYPYYAQRDRAVLSSNINSEVGNQVSGDFANLPAKFDRILTQDEEFGGRELRSFCKETWGFVPSSVLAAGGKTPALATGRGTSIALDQMGSGMLQMLGLLTELFSVEERVFLIEEPEADLHPGALRELLRIIGRSAEKNQFFISTHSSIVLRELASLEGTNIFQVTSRIEDRLPTSEVAPVGNSKRARLEVIRALGYELMDLGMYENWLILEESSAERVIKCYFIKWFCPFLVGRLRTLSAQGKDDVEPRFNAFNRLFVYLHVDGSFLNKAWIVLDGGEEEKVIIDRMRLTYAKSGWLADRFSQFSEHEFESYYPEPFREEVGRILEMTGDQRREAKRVLLEKVCAWIDADEKAAKDAFEESAAKVIEYLKGIEAAVRVG